MSWKLKQARSSKGIFEMQNVFTFVFARFNLQGIGRRERPRTGESVSDFECKDKRTDIGII